MGLKQTGAAPACHNSQGPTLPACEKRDLNPRNPFSWVRRLFPFPFAFRFPISPPKQNPLNYFNQQHPKYVITTVPKVPGHSYNTPIPILESSRYFIFLLSIIHCLLPILPPSLFQYTYIFKTTLSHKDIPRHTRHSSKPSSTHSSVPLNLFKAFT